MRRTAPFLCCMIMVLFGLTAQSAQAGLGAFSPQNAPLTPHYADASSWLIRPDVPGQYPVDVFWVYPTVLQDDEHWLMDVTDSAQRQLAAQTLVRQASVFEGQANIYAPMYRQMNMAGLGLKASTQKALLEYGKEDVWRAFRYYVKYENDGRPVIIAGHSQGSELMTMLLRKHWGELGVERRLVAAYLIGWSITKDDLLANPHLSMCESATSTNCFISYNTVAAGRQKEAPTILEGAVVVNPLSWKIDGSFVSAKENLGARFFNEDGSSLLVKEFTSAQCVDGGVVVQPKDLSRVASESSTFPAGVYHPYDYSLFYENIRQNIGVRIDAFLNQ